MEDVKESVHSESILAVFCLLGVVSPLLACDGKAGELGGDVRTGTEMRPCGGRGGGRIM